MEQSPTASARRAKIKQELIGVALIFLAVALLLALASFDKNDYVPLLQTAGGRQAANMLGLFGAFFAGYLREVFGLTAFALPAALAWRGVKKLFASIRMPRGRGLGLWGLFLAALLILGSDWFGPVARFVSGAGSALPAPHEGLNPLPGGLLGGALYSRGAKLLSPVGMYLLVTFFLIVSAQLVSGISWKEQAQRAKNLLVWLFRGLWQAFKRLLFGWRLDRSGGEGNKAGAALPGAQKIPLFFYRAGRRDIVSVDG